VYRSEPASGLVSVAGEDYDERAQAKSLARGMAMLTESRKDDGLFLGAAVAPNFVATTLAKLAGKLRLTPQHDEGRAQSVVERFGVVVDHVGLPISALSGGNQQKVLIGRLLENEPKILILDEPTRGVDVGAKAEIYKTLRALADGGMAILVISSELIEIVGLADRVYVMRDGELAAELAGDQIAEDAIMTVAAAGEPGARETAHA